MFLKGLKTASLFWTGSEVFTRSPDIFFLYDIYSNRYSFEDRCDKAVKLLKKLELDFVTLYMNEPDHNGFIILIFWENSNFVLLNLKISKGILMGLIRKNIMTQ